MGAKSCPRCKAPLQGYVDECPSCGFEKPVPLPWYIYVIMLVILLLFTWIFIDLDAMVSGFMELSGANRRG